MADGATGTTAPSPSQTLWTVQWMRAAAALMIIVGHSGGAVANIAEQGRAGFTRPNILPWGAGVDLFFVISGFIMVHASRRLFGQPNATAEFLKRRLTRIIPLYWLTTSLFLAILAAATLKGGDLFPSGTAILASYLFIPFDSYGDGRAFPVFDLGWTLNYEMFFYALFALTVWLPRARAMTMLAVLLLVAIAIGNFVPHSLNPAYFWTRPILIDFGLGIGVGMIVARGVTLSKPLRLIMAFGGIVFVALDPMHLFNGPIGTTVANEWPRVLYSGVPVSIALAGAVLGPEPRAHRALWPLTLLGDASYSLYLFHPFSLILMEKLVQKSPRIASLDGHLLLGATVTTAIVSALFAYHFIERPMTRRLNAWLAEGRAKRHVRVAADS
ncbi:MAG: acyltransferase [Sphingomonadales bacterium]|nr:acyltransferase [Sphingomonadales bacterium]